MSHVFVLGRGSRRLGARSHEAEGISRGSIARSQPVSCQDEWRYRSRKPFNDKWFCGIVNCSSTEKHRHDSGGSLPIFVWIRKPILDKTISEQVNGVVGRNPVGFRAVTLTKSAIKSGTIDLSPCGAKFFPRSVLDASDEPSSGRKALQLWLEGQEGAIATRLVEESNGKPTLTFQSHSWVGDFVSRYNLKAGDKVSIARVSPTDYRISPLWRDFTFVDLFAGIGGIRLAFESAGGKCVFTSEIDPLAQQTYEANFGDKPAGDITQIPPDSIPDHDILVGGFPCQPFSIIGNRKGFTDTRGTLFSASKRFCGSNAPKRSCLRMSNNSVLTTMGELVK